MKNAAVLRRRQPPGRPATIRDGRLSRRADRLGPIRSRLGEGARGAAAASETKTKSIGRELGAAARQKLTDLYAVIERHVRHGAATVVRPGLIKEVFPNDHISRHPFYCSAMILMSEVAGLVHEQKLEVDDIEFVFDDQQKEKRRLLEAWALSVEHFKDTDNKLIRAMLVRGRRGSRPTTIACRCKPPTSWHGGSGATHTSSFVRTTSRRYRGSTTRRCSTRSSRSASSGSAARSGVSRIGRRQGEADHADRFHARWRAPVA